MFKYHHYHNPHCEHCILSSFWRSVAISKSNSVYRSQGESQLWIHLIAHKMRLYFLQTHVILFHKSPRRDREVADVVHCPHHDLTTQNSFPSQQ